MPARWMLLLALFPIGSLLGQEAALGSRCATCHARETASFLASPMGRSIGSPSPVPNGKVNHDPSGSLISIELAGGKMQHRLSENGLTATYPIAYQIGAGQVGHSYLAEIGGYLLQSPASFYKRAGWDISPGYEGAEVLDFDRVIDSPCLFCHSDRSTVSQQRRLVGGVPVAISCDRCHGDTSVHERRPASGNVINPAKLSRRARDSICEQCHLEGLARVTNPGKALIDFRPGESLESTWTTYVAAGAAAPGHAVSQVEQLALSQCVLQSGTNLWCGTCHTPHATQYRAGGTDRHLEIRGICTSCHSALSKVGHPGAPVECESCHMPRRSPTDVAHAATTDHRILKRTTPQSAELQPASRQIRAWFEPALPIRERGIGLAEIKASSRPGWASLGPSGARRLEALSPSSISNDVPVLAAIGAVDLAEGQTPSASQALRRAAELDPSNPDLRMYAGIALKQSGDLQGAAEQFTKSIDLDPSLERAYLELSALFVREKRLGDASAILDRYLKWNPQSVFVRLSRESLPK